MANLVHFTKGGFDKALAEQHIVVVDFWASWCGPCRMVAPVIEQLAEEYAGKVLVGKVDVDAEIDLAMRYRIMSIPTVMVFVDGQQVETMVGVRPKGAYTAVIDQLL